MSEVKKEQGKRFRGRLVLLSIGLIAGVLITSSLFAGYGRHRWHRRDLSEEELLRRMTRGTSWALSTVDATDEQRARINVILAELAPDMIRLQDERRLLVGQLIQAVEADQVSPDEVERVQAAGLRLAEQAFARTTDVVLQISEVLTPEQRKELVAAWRHRR
ncbi:MAG: Spy/CpxP family protein refolding chaperone [Candidatus Methylomirabilales bacterium]